MTCEGNAGTHTAGISIRPEVELVMLARFWTKAPLASVSKKRHGCVFTHESMS